MAYNQLKQQQDQNTAKLVMKTFHEVARKDGVTSSEIAKYLTRKYGDLWRVSTLVGKAEETLKSSAKLGFLDKRGDKYVAKLARELRCGTRRKRRRRSCRHRRRRSCRRRRRPRKRSRRRRSRRRPCCCK